MNIYLLIQNECQTYDTYDAVVVVAKNEEEARKMHPSGDVWQDMSTRSWGGWGWSPRGHFSPDWASHPDKVEVHFLGVAKEGETPGVILASFNAG